MLHQPNNAYWGLFVASRRFCKRTGRESGFRGCGEVGLDPRAAAVAKTRMGPGDGTREASGVCLQRRRLQSVRSAAGVAGAVWPVRFADQAGHRVPLRDCASGGPRRRDERIRPANRYRIAGARPLGMVRHPPPRRALVDRSPGAVKHRVKTDLQRTQFHDRARVLRIDLGI